MFENKIICLCLVFLLFWGCQSKPTVSSCAENMLTTSNVIVMVEDACYQGAKSEKILGKLFEQGFPVNYVLNEFNQTALHIAVSMDNKRLVRFLLAKGADKIAVDWNGYRPIDIAYKEKNWRICRLLAQQKPQTDILFDGIPKGVWEVVLREQFWSRNMSQERLLILSVNGSPVSDTFSDWLIKQKTNIRTNSYIKGRDLKEGIKIRQDAITSEEATLCWFVLEKIHDCYYRITMNSVSGSMECQRFSICEAQKKFGYWLGELKESGHVFIPAIKNECFWPVSRAYCPVGLD